MKIKLIHKLRSTAVEVEPSLSLRVLKEQAATWSGIPMDLIKLLFRGRPCSEEQTVEETGMQEGAKVHVIQSLSQSTAEAGAPSGRLEELDRVEKEVEEIAVRVNALKNGGHEGSSSKPIVLNELLTQKLLKLDNLDVTGDERTRRKALINRINDLCSELDAVNSSDAAFSSK